MERTNLASGVAAIFTLFALGPYQEFLRFLFFSSPLSLSPVRELNSKATSSVPFNQIESKIICFHYGIVYYPILTDYLLPAPIFC